MKARQYTLAAVLLATVCGVASGATARAQQDSPRTEVTLWVWHGAQDLRGLHAVAGEDVRIALLERTIEVSPDGLRVTPRRHPVWLDPGTPRIAVVHMEVDPRVTLGQFAAMEVEIAHEALVAFETPSVRGVQMDFDAPASLRGRYASILRTLAEGRPDGMTLEMTALGSWCTSDRWLRNVPVDRIVPMLFGPGHQSDQIRNSLTRGPLPEPRCREDHGFREGDAFEGSQRVHVFPLAPWTLERAVAVLRAARER